jgi:Cyclic nucleotide-binding domain
MRLLRRKKKKRARIPLDDPQADAYIARLVAGAAEIRLTDVFGREHPDALFHVADRQGVNVVALKTTSLSEEQLLSLMRFRLAQYLEVNFVNGQVVYDGRIEYEPLAAVKPEDIHVLAGVPSTGEILCYCVIEAPLDVGPDVTLRDEDRPLLPVEHVHGWGIFNRLPVLPDLPLAKIRELGRFVKNQRYQGMEDLAVRGPLEVCVAIFRLVAETLSLEYEGIVGDFEEAIAKQNMEFFHVPMVVLHGTMPLESEAGLLYPRYQYRTVFPFACLASDASLALGRLGAIEAALEKPGKLGLLALMRLRGDKPTTRSMLAPGAGAAALADTQLQQKGVHMADRREQREAGRRLRESQLFADLSEAEATVLATFLERVESEAGETIVRQGDPSDAAYFIESGRVEVRATGPAGNSLVVAELGPGDYFGEIGILTGAERLADVVALEPLSLLRLSDDDYARFLAQLDEVQEELSRTAAGRASDTARQLLTDRTPEQ